MFLGDELTEVLRSLLDDNQAAAADKSEMKVGVHILPRFPRDTTDRNRTSPFAFTGNKFEFRSLGSTQSISAPNVILNTIVAEELSQFADVLEQAEDFNTTLHTLIVDTLREHRRIIFNGNGYSAEWLREAESRGLLNLKTTVDALPYFISEKNIQLFSKHHIYTPEEIHSRYEIYLDTYSRTIEIEALTMLDLVSKRILPACVSYSHLLAETLSMKKSLGIRSESEEGLLSRISEGMSALYQKNEALMAAQKAHPTGDPLAEGTYYRDTVIPIMNELRSIADTLEMLIGEDYWPLPSYTKMLYSLN